MQFAGPGGARRVGIRALGGPARAGPSDALLPAMSDAVVVLSTVLFFLVSVAYLQACDKL
jgi:hypothetical protein